MHGCLRHWNWCLGFLACLSVKCGRAQLFFDPSAFSLSSRGALPHALESGPKLPRFLVPTPPPPPPDAAAPAPDAPIAADPASPAAEAASPAAAAELQALLALENAETPYRSSQGLVALRHGSHGARSAAPPPPAPDLAAPTGSPTAGQGPSAAPAAAPTVAPGLNSSVNGSMPPHTTQIKDLLTPAPPALPVQAPALPAPVPVQSPPAHVATGQPQAGSKEGSPGNCEQQGLQGPCNACICCCAPKGGGGFTSYRPQGCECHKEIQTSDMWLALTMSAILVLPALLVSIWFAGLFPATPYGERLYT